MPPSDSITAVGALWTAAPWLVVAVLAVYSLTQLVPWLRDRGKNHTDLSKAEAERETKLTEIAAAAVNTAVENLKGLLEAAQSEAAAARKEAREASAKADAAEAEAAGLRGEVEALRQAVTREQRRSALYERRAGEYEERLRDVGRRIAACPEPDCPAKAALETVWPVKRSPGRRKGDRAGRDGAGE